MKKLIHRHINIFYEYLKESFQFSAFTQAFNRAIYATELGLPTRANTASLKWMVSYLTCKLQPTQDDHQRIESPVVAQSLRPRCSRPLNVNKTLHLIVLATQMPARMHWVD